MGLSHGLAQSDPIKRHPLYPNYENHTNDLSKPNFKIPIQNLTIDFKLN